MADGNTSTSGSGSGRGNVKNPAIRRIHAVRAFDLRSRVDCVVCEGLAGGQPPATLLSGFEMAWAYIYAPLCAAGREPCVPPLQQSGETDVYEFNKHQDIRELQKDPSDQYTAAPLEVKKNNGVSCTRTCVC